MNSVSETTEDLRISAPLRVPLSPDEPKTLVDVFEFVARRQIDRPLRSEVVEVAGRRLDVPGVAAVDHRIFRGDEHRATRRRPGAT